MPQYDSIVKVWFGLVYSVNGISNPYGLINSEVWLIFKRLLFWNFVTVYKLFVLDKNACNHIIVW